MENLPDVVTMVQISLSGIAIATLLRWLDRVFPLVYSLPLAFFVGLVAFLTLVAPSAVWPVLVATSLAFCATILHLWYDKKWLNWMVVIAAIVLLVVTKVDSALFFVGVSYLAFRTIEAYLQAPIAARNLPRKKVLFAVFGHFFNPLTLASGPISRLESALTIVERERYMSPDFIDALYRVALGLLRIYVLAMIFSQYGFQDVSVLGYPAPLLALAAAFFQFLFVYYTFAGYCDIVIGIGKAAGYPIDENFDNPLFSGNIGEFWGRFHMSLTAFLKDYFVNPLVRAGAMRFGPSAVIWLFLPISIVNFLIIGMWHGWGLQFLYLGVAHATGFAVFWLYDRFVGKRLPKPWRKHRVYKAAAVVLTIGWISFATSFIFVDPSFWTAAWGIK